MPPTHRHAQFALTTAIILIAGLLAGCMNAPPAATIDDDTDGIATTNEVGMKDMLFTPDAITVAPGTTVTWTNLEATKHTVTPTDKAAWGTDGSGDAVADWLGQGDTWSHTFTEEGTYTYYCLPHATQGADGEYVGMVGKVVVSASAAGGTGSGGGGTHGGLAPAPAAATPDVAEIGRDAGDVPPPITRTEPAHLTFNITSKEVDATMSDGTTYRYWTFDGTVPGPMLRVRVGDTVTVNHHNDATSTMEHDIDFHAVTGPGGGAAALRAAPGETASLTFKALNAGLYVYHCAAATPPVHIAHGMYGMILVEPEEGLPPVDREYYVVQGDFYTRFDPATKGHHTYGSDPAAAENPAWVVMNGRVGSLTGERALTAGTGETVRIYFGVGGPNKVSSFHVIGEIFDTVHDQGGIGTPPLENIQTTLVPAGGATIVEFQVEVPGTYVLVDHSINRVLKGAAGHLVVTGPDDHDVFDDRHMAS